MIVCSADRSVKIPPDDLQSRKSGGFSACKYSIVKNEKLFIEII